MRKDFYQRNIVDYAIDLKEKFPVLAVIGARQVGKTVLTQTIAKDFTYLDLEKASDYDRVSHDIEFFFKQNPNKVLFDEAQELPALCAALRGVIDQSRDQNNRFILTGSSSPDLLNQISETLAGRVAIIELGTLKANELYQQPISEFYQLFKQPLSRQMISLDWNNRGMVQTQHAWFQGGYPQPAHRDQNYRQEWMTHYEKTYLNRDIAKLFPRLDHLAYRRFLNMLGSLSSKIINKSDLARSIGVSEPTIRQYLSIANGTFLWRELPSFENNMTKSVVKMPRGHIRDSGLLHYLLRIHSLEDLNNHPICGFSFEAFVIEEILKGLQDAGIPGVNAFYYRTRAGAEIDLILQGYFGVLPIEIKYGSTIIRKQLRALNDFVELQKTPFGIVINQAESMEWLTDKILQIPAGCL